MYLPSWNKILSLYFNESTGIRHINCWNDTCNFYNILNSGMNLHLQNEKEKYHMWPYL